MKDFKYADLTDKIIGACYKIYNTLGSGFLESVYENCLIIELKKLGLLVESQKSIQVFYDNQEVGFFIADIIVENKIILELKAIKELAKIHEVQLVNYLTATGKDVGLLINFGSKEVQVKRKVRVLSQIIGQDELDRQDKNGKMKTKKERHYPVNLVDHVK